MPNLNPNKILALTGQVIARVPVLFVQLALIVLLMLGTLIFMAADWVLSIYERLDDRFPRRGQWFDD